MDTHSLTCMLCRFDHVWTLLRLIRGDGLSPQLVADAGYRSSSPSAAFTRVLTRAWRKLKPPFPDVKVLREHGGMLECEIPNWVCQVQSQSQLSGIVIFSECHWRDHLVAPVSWPVNEEAGIRFNGVITNEQLPVAKQVHEILRRTSNVSDALLLQMRQEWQEYVADLGVTGDWVMPDQQHDYRAIGSIPISECRLQTGAIPMEYVAGIGV